ncbi:diguanylate cyclase [Marinifilum sp. JC120]|nr:diguanylate cyclase [Marinifilum sp. JC120]
MPKHINENETVRADLEKYFSSYLEQLPAIAWRVDIVENKISFLNSFVIPNQNHNIRDVLQKPQLARNMILEEDWERFQNCFQQIRNRVATTCVFRMHSAKNSTRWLKIVAMPDPIQQTCSIGLLIDISTQVDIVLTTEGKPSLSTKINLIEDPVLFVRFSDRSVYSANNAAEDLLKYDQQKLLSLNFQDIFRNNTDADLHKLYEALIFSDRWNGKLNVTDSQNRHHKCAVNIQALSRNEENLLWITLIHQNDCPTCKGIPVHGNETLPLKGISKALAKCNTVKCLLKTMLKTIPTGSSTDAIMFSHISISENKVKVTGAGTPFAKLSENRTHPYEGSIAENIVRFNLKKHVVMETSKSIKPIDWALFIPHGIHSYYAQPFYDNGILTGVLVFCSTKSHGYDADAAAPLHEVYEEFLANMKRCLN